MGKLDPWLGPVFGACEEGNVGLYHDKLKGGLSLSSLPWGNQKRPQTETTQKQTIQRKFLMFQPL